MSKKVIALSGRRKDIGASFSQLDLVQRSSSEMAYDRDYADYWLGEYGFFPDDIRSRHLFPAIHDLLAPLNTVRDRKVFYDFGCGAGSAIFGVRDWCCKKYVGIDVNENFISSCKANFSTENLYRYEIDFPLEFRRRNFDQIGWCSGIEKPFDIGLSLFVLNELENPINYLKGIRSLRSRKISIANRSRLIVAVTHPVLALKDLADFYYGRANSRKFDNVEFYHSNTGQKSYYNFSRGNFKARYRHWSLEELIRIFDESRLRIEKLREIYYPSIEGVESSKDHISAQYPRVLLFRLGFH